MDLHYIDGSPFARIVRVLAREHGVDWKEIEIVEFPPADSYLDLNPLGQVPVLVDGGRAYFRTSDASGTSKRLRRNDWVQVAPCTVLGVCRTGPTVDATARLLIDAEASWAGEQLARRYPAWRRYLSSLAQLVTGRRTVYYELQPDEVPEEPTVPPAVTAKARKRARVRLGPAVAGRRSGR